MSTSDETSTPPRLSSGHDALDTDALAWGDATRIVVEPLRNEPGVRPVAPALHASSTYEFDSCREAADFHLDPDGGYTYTRWGNPTVRAAEHAVAQIERAESCALFASGMGAISTALLALLQAGDELIAPHNLYGGTHHLLAELLPRYGITTRFVETTDLVAAVAEAGPKVRVVYFEPVSNPTLRLVDVADVVAAARARGGLAVVVDNTLATPLSLRPLELGADLVVHSATKYLGGHSDLLAGAVCGSVARVEPVRRTGRLLGGGFNPREAWLLMRGLKTLGVRFPRQVATAQALAAWLEGRPEVRRVWQPALASHPEHELAARQLGAGVALVTLELHDEAQAWGFVDALRLWRRAVSLGGVESLASISVLSSHHGVDATSLERAGVTAATVRLSVGLEDEADLRHDLAQALEASRAGRSG